MSFSFSARATVGALAAVVVVLLVVLAMMPSCGCSGTWVRVAGAQEGTQEGTQEALIPQRGSSYGWNLADGAVWRRPAGSFVDEESPSQYL